MRRTGKAGLAQFVLREREYLVAVKPTGGVLSLITLHYQEEILSDQDMAPESGPIKSEETNRMKAIIKAMTISFNPNKYADERRNKIVNILEKLTKEKALVKAPEVAEEEEKDLVDLVSVLQESMRKVKENR